MRLNKSDRWLLHGVRLIGLVATVAATIADPTLGLLTAYVATSVFLVRCRKAG